MRNRREQISSLDYIGSNIRLKLEMILDKPQTYTIASENTPSGVSFSDLQWPAVNTQWNRDRAD